MSQLPANLASAIGEYFSVHGLGEPESNTMDCCETITTWHTPGRIASLLNGNPDTTTHLALLLADDWLIWARSGDRSGTTVDGAKLSVIKVKAYSARRTGDLQLEVNGFVNDSKDYVRGTLMLGSGLTAQKFCDKVVETNLKVYPPSKRKYPKWLGG